jgi:hypothetical protein
MSAYQGVQVLAFSLRQQYFGRLGARHIVLLYSQDMGAL